MADGIDNRADGEVQPPTPRRLAELPEHTREFLSRLSPDDIDTLNIGIPIFRKVMGTGQVLKWCGFAVLSLAAGIVLLGESIGKILSWIRS